MGVKIMLTGVRCAFLTLGEPDYFQGKKQKDTDKRRWSATALVPVDSPLKKLVDDTLRAVAQEKWEKKWQGYYDAIMMDPKGTCWLDGKRKPDYDGFQGHFALSAHRTEDKGRPLVMDNDKSPLYKPDNSVYEGKAGRIYAGCFVNMQVEIWAQENQTGKGLRASLLGIQRVRDGDAFGGGAAPTADDFGEITDGAEAEDLT